MEAAARRRWDEVEALAAIFGGDGELEVLEGCAPGSAEEAATVRLRVRLEVAALPWVVLVELPRGYPAEAGPGFRVEAGEAAAAAAARGFGSGGSASRAAARLAAAAEGLLAAAAAARAGEECVHEALLAFEALDLQEVLGAPSAAGAGVDAAGGGPGPGAGGGSWWRTVVRIDHMNDPRGYTRTLEGWVREGGLSLALYRCPSANGRWRGILMVLDAPSQDSAAAFLRRFRTQAVDVDGRGEPCKERCATVLCELLELPLAGLAAGYRSVELAGGPEELAAVCAAAQAGAPDPAEGGAGEGGAGGGGGAGTWVSEARGGGALLQVAVRPGSSGSELTNLAELRRGARSLHADLHAQPRDGEANAELLKLLAKRLGVPAGSLGLVGGGKSRDKQVRVEGLTPHEVAARLLAPAGL